MAPSSDDNASPALLRALAKAYKSVNAELGRRLEPHGLHPGQDYVLDLLWKEDGLPIGVLAERVGVEVPTLVRTVTRMEAAGLIRREEDPSDRRRVRVTLTERGRELERVVPPILAEVTEVASAHLSERERRQLIEALRGVREGLRGE
jgi:MarR family transcriptional regulator, organic hydroperoxide resistance regulator